MYVDVGKFGSNSRVGIVGGCSVGFGLEFTIPPTKTVQAYTRDPTTSDLERLDKFG